MNLKTFSRFSVLITLLILLFPINNFAEERHLRGTWISTVVNLDWPSQKTSSIKNDSERIKQSKKELIAILDKAVEMKLNAVFFQVSPEGDALYKSNIVPWSRYLTGTFGKNPGFDPLAFAIHEAHLRNLEFHAWFNPYRVSMKTDNATKSFLNINKSVYKEHPTWIKISNNRFVVDPGIPEARAWVIKRVLEVVRNYDVDGVHFDDYFYYEKFKGEMKDKSTFNKYNKGKFSSIEDWRRNNTYLLVKELSSKIHKLKPWVKFGISPAGVWGNKSDGHLDGSNTKGGFTNYERSFADTKKWVKEELIDYIAPQIYFSFANTSAPYGELAGWWSNICKGKKVHLYIGQALYKVNADPDKSFGGNNAVSEFIKQLKFNIAKSGIKGSIMFRVSNFTNPEKQKVVNAIKSNVWSAKTLVPVMPWKGGKTPSAPSKGKLKIITSNSNKIYWTNTDLRTAYFAVYRFNKGSKVNIGPSNLIATVRKINNATQVYSDKPNSKVFYVITALDRLHNESKGLVIK